jgi:hypothetical protein
LFGHSQKTQEAGVCEHLTAAQRARAGAVCTTPHYGRNGGVIPLPFEPLVFHYFGGTANIYCTLSVVF